MGALIVGIRLQHGAIVSVSAHRFLRKHYEAWSLGLLLADHYMLIKADVFARSRICVEQAAPDTARRDLSPGNILPNTPLLLQLQICIFYIIVNHSRKDEF